MTPRLTANEAERLLSRINGFWGVKSQRPDELVVECDDKAVRAVKSKLMREGYSYQPRLRDVGGNEHVFKHSGGRRGPPRNSRELTRDLQRGDFVFGGGR